MTTLTPTRLAAMPRVNLLPPEIAAAARLKRTKALLGFVMLAAMAAVVLVYLVVSSQVGGAEEELSTAQAQGAALQSQVNEYAEVPEVARGGGRRSGQPHHRDDPRDPLVVLPQRPQPLDPQDAPA